MYVKAIPLGPVSANCYIICDEKTKIGAVIDPGDYNAVLLKEIVASGMKELKYILCTHSHFDHVSGAGRLKEKYPDAKILVGQEDAHALNDAVFSLAAFFGAPFYPCVSDKTLKDGDEIKIGDISFKIISTPGHSPGGVLYYSESEKTVFTGDTVFKGSVGRTDLYGGDTKTLTDSLKKIKKLPADCVIFSGHGEKTTVEHELKYNMFLR